MGDWFAANRDYLLFAAAVAAALAGLDGWLRRRPNPGRLPRWTGPVAAAVLAAGWLLVAEGGEAEHARIRNFLQGVAPTYAQELERMGHAAMAENTAPDDPAYLAMIEAQKRWLRVNPTVADIYTYRRTTGGVRLMVDSETDYNRDGRYEGPREARLPIGRLYEQADEPMLRALDGMPTFSARPVRDEWGVWVSAQVPLRDAQGRVEAALGVDYPAEEWVRAIAHGRQRMLWFLAIPLLILGFAATLAGALRAELAARLDVEQKLRASEARLRAAIENLPCDFWMMDGALRYTLLNAASREHWGDTIGRSLDDLKIAQTTRAEWAAVNRRAFAGEVVRHDVAYDVRGRTHHFSSVVTPVRIDGAVVGILGVNFDITERVEAEQALRKSEEKLALHVRHTPLAVIEWDLAGQITAWNPAAERIFGFSAAEAIGRTPVGFIIAEEGRARIEKLWAALLTHRGGTRSTNENLTKAGRVIRCEWYNTPLVDATGAVIGVASSVQDVTERDALERQLRHAQKMESVGQLAGGVAHEFNNLLTPMLVQTDLIAFHYPGDARLLTYLRPVQDAIDQAAKLNQRILAVGRRTAEVKELQAFNTLIEQSLEILRPSLDRRIELRVDLAPGLAPLLLERAAVVQIVMNLVLNARDTVLERLQRGAPDGWRPRIGITTATATSAERRDGTSAMPFPLPFERLSVTDNGCGIPDAVRAKVFEPFFTTKGPGQGTGLGLAVVWNVVHGMGGWVDFEPGPDGEGTRFNVFLPLTDLPGALVGAEPAGAAPPVQAVGRPAVRPLRVLLAEDNALVAETIAALLGASGHQVTAAPDGEQAWQWFSRRPDGFDAIVTDYNMPGLNGADLVQRVRQASGTVRIVVVSGYLSAERVDQLRRVGADTVLHKPFAPASLLAAIEDRA